MVWLSVIRVMIHIIVITNLFNNYVALVVSKDDNTGDNNNDDDNCNVTHTKSDTIINYRHDNRNNKRIQNCLNHIRAPNGYRIVITILWLDIPMQSNALFVCNRHYLSFGAVFPSIDKVVKLCGHINDTAVGSKKTVIAYNSSITFHLHFDSTFSDSKDKIGYSFRVEFIKTCTNTSLFALKRTQQYCSPNNYSISYLRSYSTREKCAIEIDTAIDHTSIRLNFTKITTSNTGPDIGGRHCAAEYLEVLANDNKQFKLCGNWSHTDLQLLSTFSAHNASIVVIVHSSANPVEGKYFDASLGFCFNYESYDDDRRNCLSDTEWTEGSDHCYRVFAEKKTWSDAQKVCQIYKNGNLVSVTSRKIQQILDQLLAVEYDIKEVNDSSDSELAFWIGANDIEYENNFQWADGQTFRYSNWFSGWPPHHSSNQDNYGSQPSDDGFSQQNCIEMRNQFYYGNKAGKRTTLNFYWNDISCLTLNAFICQIPKIAGNTGAKGCEDTISALNACAKHNPCGERGNCTVINGVAKCKCHRWYEGVYCERIALKVNYKPLSKRMLEEPFWLGLMTVAGVLALLSIIYCIKKKFAERIETFFAEEIERSKSNYNIPRYSLTSNAGVSINISPVNISPIPRSRSSLISRLCKPKTKVSSNRMHPYSDSEVTGDQFSDAESGRAFPYISPFIRHAYSARDTDLSRDDNVRGDEKTRNLLQSLVGSGNSVKNRRLSLDEFIQNSSNMIKMQRLMSIDHSVTDESFSDAESSFISTVRSSGNSTPGRKSPIYFLRQISAISEKSQEDDSSRVTSRNNTIASDSSPESLFYNLQYLKHESEAEILLNGIQSIQRASRSRLNLSANNNDDIDNPQPSTSGYTKDSKCICSSSTSSGSSTPNNHFAKPPSITITDAAIEHYDQDSENDAHTSSVHSSSGYNNKRSSSCSSTPTELCVPVQNIRRLSEPMTSNVDDGKRSPSPGSLSCGSSITKPPLESTKGRKFSLDSPVPKIQINTDKISCDPNVTPNPGMKAMSYLTPMTYLTPIINASSDRTISESNLSTSGYSSLSSPGISRCNSSSPFPEEIGGVNSELTTIVIPDVPQMEFRKNYDSKPNNFGTFLTIPVFAYPPATRDQTNNSRNCAKETNNPNAYVQNKPSIICPQITISHADYDDSRCVNREESMIADDEGIDVDADLYQKRPKGEETTEHKLSQTTKSANKKVSSKSDTLLAPVKHSKEMKKRKKRVPSPTHSLEEFNPEALNRKTDYLKTPQIRRNPSWPAVLVSPHSSSSSDCEEKSKYFLRNSYRRHSSNKKPFTTTKIKRYHKKTAKVKPLQSPTVSTLSVHSANCDTNRSSATHGCGAHYFFHSSQSSPSSSSSESFVSTNDDENTVISQSLPKKHYSSQNLCLFAHNYPSDSDSLPRDRHKQKAIASISDTALDQSLHNYSKQSFPSRYLTAPTNELFSKRKCAKNKMQKQYSMREDDGSHSSDEACSSETSVLVNNSAITPAILTKSSVEVDFRPISAAKNAITTEFN